MNEGDVREPGEEPRGPDGAVRARAVAGGDGAGPLPRERRWRGRDLAWMFGTILLLLIGGSTVFAALDPTPAVASLLAAALEALVFAGVAAVLIRAHPARPAGVGLKRAPSRDVLMAAVLAMPLLPLFGGVATLVRLALGEPADNPQVAFLLPAGITPVETALMALLVGGAVPFAEELVFRGVLLDALRERWGPRVAVVVSSGLFGLMHVEPSIVVATALLGGVLGVLRLRSDSLWPAVALHAANNTLAMVAILVAEG